jgi:hypothetical protein
MCQTIRLAVLSGLVAVLAWGCSDQSAAGPAAPGSANAGHAATPTPTGTNAASGLPNWPADAQWTLACKSYSGSAHVVDAERARSAAIAATHSNDWYIIHTDAVSTLYFGFFATLGDRNNPAAAAHAQTVRNQIAAYTDALGDHPFETCTFVPIDTPDPNHHPEWNLTNAKGFWSLQIAAFKGNVKRKEAAELEVSQLRQHGVEAYYYHTAPMSIVCIGAWPREAVKEQAMSSAQADPNSVPLVLPEALPLGLQVDPNMQVNGKKVEPMAPVAEIVDPTMIAAKRAYPNNAVNYVVSKQVGKDKYGNTVTVEDPSFLVQIPAQADTLLTNTTPLSGFDRGAAGGFDAPPAGGAPGTPGDTNASPPTPGAGRLRSIGG